MKRIVVFFALVFVLVSGSRSAAQVAFEGFEFAVNTYTTGQQSDARVVGLDTGGFVVVYESDGLDGDADAIAARVYDSDGSPLGTEFVLNAHTTSSQRAPGVAAQPGGDFLVVWQSFRQAGSSSQEDVFGRRFASDGSPLGAEFQVNTLTTGRQKYPNIATRMDGQFIVSWEAEYLDGDRTGVAARRFAADGTPAGTEFQVNTYTTHKQSPGRGGSPTVAWYDEQHFVVTWQSYLQDGPENAVVARRYDENATAQGGEFLVSVITAGNQSAPTVGSPGDGTFIVAWNDRGFASYTFLRRYDSNGSPLTGGENVGASTTTSNPVIAVEDDASFTLAWTGADASAGGIVSRRFEADGTPEADAFAVNTYTTTTQQRPSLLVGPGEDFVVVWESIGQDGDGRGVFGQRLAGIGICGDATRDEVITASDALLILKVAVGLDQCSCVCDVNGGSTTASDALTVLQASVGLPVALDCPAC